MLFPGFEEKEKEGEHTLKEMKSKEKKWKISSLYPEAFQG